MLTNRLISPPPSYMRFLSTGSWPFNYSIMDWISDAWVSTSPFPPVRGRRGVGMRTLIMKRTFVFAQVEHLLKLYQARSDSGRAAHRVNDRILGFQTVAGDECHRHILPLDDALFDQSLEHTDRDASSRLGEDALRLCEQRHAVHNFIVSHRLHGATAFGGGLQCIIAVCGIADGQRLRDGFRLDGLEEVTALLVGGGDGGTALRLCAVDARRKTVDQPQLVKLIQAFPHLRQQ